MTDVEDQGVYRPLFVMVEAVEAEARRLLAKQPTGFCKPDLVSFERAMRAYRPGCETLRIHREERSRAIVVSVVCSLCGKRHEARMSEISLNDSKDDAATFVDFIDDMLERPCPKGVQLGAAGLAR